MRFGPPIEVQCTSWGVALQLLACLFVSLIFGCSQYGAPAIRCSDRETIASSIRAGGGLETRDVFVGETYDARFWLANEGDVAISFCFLRCDTL